MQHVYLATITNFKFGDRHAWSPNCKFDPKNVPHYKSKANQTKPTETSHNIKQKSKGGHSVF